MLTISFEYYEFIILSIVLFYSAHFFIKIRNKNRYEEFFRSFKDLFKIIFDYFIIILFLMIEKNLIYDNYIKFHFFIIKKMKINFIL